MQKYILKLPTFVFLKNKKSKKIKCVYIRKYLKLYAFKDFPYFHIK